QHGPMVSVRSALVGESGSREDDLVDVLPGERDRLFDHTGIDEPDPTDVDERVATIVIDGARTPATVRAEGNLWAARCELEGPEGKTLIVTLVSRGVSVE